MCMLFAGLRGLQNRSSEAATSDQLLQGVAGNRVVLLNEACQSLEARMVGIACRVAISQSSAFASRGCTSRRSGNARMIW
mgnify:CR=1 FL=1|jgi:hypothetical protein